jgi:hypothetical protein
LGGRFDVGSMYPRYKFSSKKVMLPGLSQWALPNVIQLRVRLHVYSFLKLYIFHFRISLFVF